MRKRYLILFIVILSLTTGCSFNNINELTNSELAQVILENNNSRTNTAHRGYKFYLPKNMTMIKDQNSNNVLYSESEKYYLYVDLLSYYKKNNNEYKINSEKKAIFSKILDYNGKKGYILVTEYENKYFLEIMYNHAKIEVITKDHHKALANALVVLNSIKYNDAIINSLVGDNILSYGEEEYTLLSPSSGTNDFLKYEEEFGIFDDKEGELPDEDKIEIKNNE